MSPATLCTCLRDMKSWVIVLPDPTCKATHAEEKR